MKVALSHNVSFLCSVSDLEFILNPAYRESYGEDVGESDTDQDYDASEDSYESDFIDDGEVEVPKDNDVSDSMDDDDLCSTPDHKPGLLLNVAVKYFFLRVVWQ